MQPKPIKIEYTIKYREYEDFEGYYDIRFKTDKTPEERMKELFERCVSMYGQDMCLGIEYRIIYESEPVTLLL